jgi:hypothetical protein
MQEDSGSVPAEPRQRGSYSCIPSCSVISRSSGQGNTTPSHHSSPHQTPHPGNPLSSLLPHDAPDMAPPSHAPCLDCSPDGSHPQHLWPHVSDGLLPHAKKHCSSSAAPTMHTHKNRAMLLPSSMGTLRSEQAGAGTAQNLSHEDSRSAIPPLLQESVRQPAGYMAPFSQPLSQPASGSFAGSQLQAGDLSWLRSERKSDFSDCLSSILSSAMAQQQQQSTQLNQLGIMRSMCQSEAEVAVLHDIGAALGQHQQQVRHGRQYEYTGIACHSCHSPRFLSGMSFTFEATSSGPMPNRLNMLPTCGTCGHQPRQPILQYDLCRVRGQFHPSLMPALRLHSRLFRTSCPASHTNTSTTASRCLRCYEASALTS